MLRDKVNEELKEAMKSKDAKRVSTLRLIMAAAKDKDIAVRSKGNDKGISEEEFLSLLQSMVKQRRDSIEMYKQGGREDLVASENAEIDVIEGFLPKQFDEAEMTDAIKTVIAETGAEAMRDMGKVMTALREKYAGQMDFGKASGMVKQALS